MASRTVRVVWQVLVGYGLWAVCQGAIAGPAAPALLDRAPFEQLTPAWKKRIAELVNHPTLTSKGNAEYFKGSLSHYEWFLDHPDLATKLWRRLGAKCTEITDEGNGAFRWTDQQGSALRWATVINRPGLRVWFADGKIRPGLLLPEVPVTAMVILRYGEYQDRLGKTALQHQAELYFHTDSKTAALIAKILGPAAPKLAEQCVGQLEMFFSALVAYLDRHPDKFWSLLLSVIPLDAPAYSDQIPQAPSQR